MKQNLRGTIKNIIFILVVSAAEEKPLAIQTTLINRKAGRALGPRVYLRVWGSFKGLGF